MELACALVLLIVGSVTAGPYGYGTKGGAAAKADARAVAGAYTGAGSIPLSIPSGASYSGSFSQSSSSSSSSSSASSNSFTYSGSGAIGGVLPGGNGCSSGNCNAGGATGSQGSAAAGSQAYSGANAGSFAGGYGSKIPSGSYGHKYGNGETQPNKDQDCGSGKCQGTSDLNPSSGIGSQSSNDAKAAASAEAGHAAGSKCGGSECDNISGVEKCVSGQCGSKEKCASGDCGAATHIGGTSTYDESNKCASGQCGLNQNTDGSSSIDSETNDINVHTSGSANLKPSYGANKPGCSNGNCNSSPAPGSPTAFGYKKPALDLTAPKLEPPCSGSNCQVSTSDYSSPSGQTKAPYLSTSNQNENQFGDAFSGYGDYSKPTYPHGSSYSQVKPSGGIGCAPGTPGCGVTAPLSGPSAPGYGGPSSSIPSYSHGSTPLVNPSSPACAPGAPGCISSPTSGVPSHCASGVCDAHPPSVPSDVGAKPSYAHGSSPSFSSLNPASSACAPGIPGCSINPSASRPSDCASGNCVAYPSGYSSSSGSSGIKPSYSHGSSPPYSAVNPSSSDCTPGTLGCTTSPSGTLGCSTGNCGSSLTSTGNSDFSNKPNYSQGNLPTYPYAKPSGAACSPGSPGCATSTSPSGPSGCTTGNCGGSPISTGYNDFSNKPSYSHSGLPPYFPSKPSGPGCAPGSPGCNLASSPTGPIGLGQDSSLNIKPSYSHGSSLSHAHVNPLGLPCAPGTPGCSPMPLASKPCVSENCGAYPSASGYGGSSNIKPNYSQGSPSFSTLVPSGLACSPGSRGCGVSPAASGPSGCASGNCGTYPTSPGSGSLGIKPSYAFGGLPAYAQVTPSGPTCAPGTPGCALPSPSIPSSCASGNCDEFPPIGGQVGFQAIKPSYSQGSSSYSPVNPSGPGCTPGAPGCTITPALSSPAGCASGNCGANPLPQGCPTGTPGCSGSHIHSGTSDYPTGHPNTGASIPVSGVPTYGTSSLGSGQTSTGISGPGYGASSVGSTSHQAAFGSHGTGSLPTFNKPSTGFPSIPSVSSIAPGSSPQLGIAAATGGASAHDTKENLPAYTGGFGGPAGVLKPNEYSATSAPSYDNKPIISTSLTTVKPSCVSGICNTQASPSLAHTGTASGAHTNTDTSANANAVAYTGGFGGPPGLLKPYDNGKADIKGATALGTSLDSHPGVGGSGYLSGGSQVGGNAVSQAGAAAVSSAGANSGDGKLHGGYNGGYSHGHDGAGGCGGGCGGSGSGSLGYSGSLGLSKTGVLDDSNNGLAAAGAVAKSVANASSGARAFGSSYASSSATAHAGASVKGGYGRR